MIGVWNTIASYAIFVAVHFALPSSTSSAVVVVTAYIFALPLAFTMQKLFVFMSSGRWFAELRRFTVANSVVFVANLIFLPAFVRLSGLGAVPSQAVFVAVCAVFSYLAHKHYSFRTNHD